MSIEIQCMTEKLIVKTIRLDYSKVPSKSTVPTYAFKFKNNNYFLFFISIQTGKFISNFYEKFGQAGS